MAQSAYDFQLFEAEQSSRARAGSRPRLRAVKGGKSRLTEKLGGLLLYTKVIVAATIVLALSISLLQSKAQLVELSSQLQRETKALAEMQSEYNYYANELDSMTSLSSVEAVATQLGLMRIEASQITYVRLESESRITRAASPLSQWSQLLKTSSESIFQYFNP